MAKSLYSDVGIGNLDPDDFNNFATQRRRADQAYQLGQAQNTYKRTTFDQQYASGKRDLRQQYMQQRRGFGADLNRRGLLNSGIYNNAYRNLQTQRNNQAADLTMQYNQMTGGLNLANQQLERVRTDALNDIESAEDARRKSVAAALKAAREM